MFVLLQMSIPGSPSVSRHPSFRCPALPLCHCHVTEDQLQWPRGAATRPPRGGHVHRDGDRWVTGLIYRHYIWSVRGFVWFEICDGGTEWLRQRHQTPVTTYCSIKNDSEAIWRLFQGKKLHNLDLKLCTFWTNLVLYLSFHDWIDKIKQKFHWHQPENQPPVIWFKFSVNPDWGTNVMWHQLSVTELRTQTRRKQRTTQKCLISDKKTSSQFGRK